MKLCVVRGDVCNSVFTYVNVGYGWVFVLKNVPEHFLREICKKKVDQYIGK